MTPDFLEVYKVSDNICDLLLDLWNISNDKEPGHINSGVNKDVKESIDLAFHFSTHKIPPPQIIKYLDELQLCIDTYINTYPYSEPFDSSLVVSGISIQYYPRGGGFKKYHTERHMAKLPFSARHLVFMTYLNTVDDVGEYHGGTEWFHQNFKLKAIKGTTIIWPVDWTFTHRGIVAPYKEKIIITGWLSFTE